MWIKTIELLLESPFNLNWCATSPKYVICAIYYVHPFQHFSLSLYIVCIYIYLVKDLYNNTRTYQKWIGNSICENKVLFQLFSFAYFRYIIPLNIYYNMVLLNFKQQKYTIYTQYQIYGQFICYSMSYVEPNM